MGELESQNRADVEPSDLVLGYVRDSISENTKRAYRPDREHFLDWGGSISATEVMLADYLAQYAEALPGAHKCPLPTNRCVNLMSAISQKRT